MYSIPIIDAGSSGSSEAPKGVDYVQSSCFRRTFPLLPGSVSPSSAPIVQRSSSPRTNTLLLPRLLMIFPLLLLCLLLCTVVALVITSLVSTIYLLTCVNNSLPCAKPEDLTMKPRIPDVLKTNVTQYSWQLPDSDLQHAQYFHHKNRYFQGRPEFINQSEQGVELKQPRLPLDPIANFVEKSKHYQTTIAKFFGSVDNNNIRELSTDSRIEESEGLPFKISKGDSLLHSNLTLLLKNSTISSRRKPNLITHEVSTDSDSGTESGPGAVEPRTASPLQKKRSTIRSFQAFQVFPVSSSNNETTN